MKAEDARHGDKPERLVLPKPSGKNFRLIAEPVPPTWRDFWAILRRRHEPRLQVYELLDIEGVNKTLKEVWTSERLIEQLEGSPFIERNVPKISPEDNFRK